MTQQFFYSKIIIKNFVLAFSFFLLTECLIFFALFWSLLYFSVNPAFWVGGVWPPIGIQAPSPFGLAFYNTFILFSSSCSLIWVELAIQTRARQSEVIIGLTLTIGAGIHFVCCQLLEFTRVSFTMNDGIYGCLFYSITGIHFIHILIGLFLIILLWCRIFYQKF